MYLATYVVHTYVHIRILNVRICSKYTIIHIATDMEKVFFESVRVMYTYVQYVCVAIIIVRTYICMAFYH